MNETTKAMQSKNKKYYKNLIGEHKKILTKARQLIGIMLDRLEEEIQNFETMHEEYEASISLRNICKTRFPQMKEWLNIHG